MNLQADYLDAGSQGGHAPSPALGRVLARLPEGTRAGLSEAQLAALDAALDANNPTRHVINLRVTLFGFAYLVILAGRERRNGARRAVERQKHPLHTPGNLAVLAILAALGLASGYALRTLVFGG
ncbi:MAG: hypothetical protein RH942_01850 [Kiloniellaceae bacterium]